LLNLKKSNTRQTFSVLLYALCQRMTSSDPDHSKLPVLTLCIFLSFSGIEQQNLGMNGLI